MMLSPFRARLLSVTILAALLSWSTVTSAQGADKAAAEALFQQAKDLFSEEKYDAACEKLAASQKLDPAVGTLLYLGDCEEKRGHTASAWAAFQEAASLAESEGQAERKEIAEVRAAALAPQVSKLEVRVPDPVEGLVVRRNGVAMPRPSWGSPLPLDAGTYELEATAPGRRSWTEEVTITDGGEVFTVEVPALEEETSSPAPVPQPLPSSPPGEDDRGSGDAMQISGIVIGSVGVVGLVVGGVFGGLAQSSNDESMKHCRTETFCNEEGVALREDAQTQATVSTATFVAGGVLAAGGLTLFLLAPSDDDEAGAEMGLSTVLGPGRAGVVLEGSF